MILDGTWPPHCHSINVFAGNFLKAIKVHLEVITPGSLDSSNDRILLHADMMCCTVCTNHFLGDTIEVFWGETGPCALTTQVPAM